MKPRSYHLGTQVSAALDELLLTRPELSAQQIARLLLARTGRSIDPVSVRRRRRNRAAGVRPRPYLSEEDRATLRAVCRAASPDFCRVEIAREFTVMTGRSISGGTVSRFVRSELGVPKLAGPGSGRAEVEVPARIAAAEARRLERLKVDRSERAGHSGRVVMGGDR